MKESKLNEMLGKKKVIFYTIGAHKRVLANGYKVDLVHLYIILKNYIKFVQELKSLNGFKINFTEINNAVSILFLGVKVDPLTLAKIYIEIFDNNSLTPEFKPVSLRYFSNKENKKCLPVEPN